jgi:ATP synthase protein I
MTDPDEDSEEALTRLGVRLDAIDATRTRRAAPIGEATGAGEGYRLLGTLIGGVLGGLGLGWCFDRLAHTAPFGLIGGLLIGAAASIYTVVRSATAASAPQDHPLSSRDDGDDRHGTGG